MANHKSAKKRIIRNANRALINGARISRIRTFVKKVDVSQDDAHLDISLAVKVRRYISNNVSGA